LFATGFVDTGGKFATSVVDSGGAPLLVNISANIRKRKSFPAEFNTAFFLNFQ
jgi:hypothetical protein